MRALRERIYLANLIPFRLSEKREKNIYSEEEEKALATFTEHRL